MMSSKLPASRPAARLAAYVSAVVGPLALTAGIQLLTVWPRPYSWQYLGVTMVVALLAGAGPGAVTLVLSYGALVALQIPTPVHPGAEMFAAVGIALLILVRQRRRTEEALQQQARALAGSRATLERNTRLLRAISDESSDVIFAKDRDGRMQFANPAMLARIGRPAEDVIGKTELEYLVDANAARQVTENDRRVMDDGVAQDVEEVVPQSDESERVWLVRKAPYRDVGGQVVGLLGIGRDITRLKEDEAALRNSERRYREIAEALSFERQKLAAVIRALPLGVVVTDAKGAILSMNDAGLRLHGFGSQQEMLAALPDHERRFEFVDLDGRPVPPSEWPAARALGGDVCSGLELKLRNLETRTERVVSYSVVPIPNTAGEPLLFAHVIDDITDRKTAEAAVHEANDRLRAEDARKNEFIAVLSHELRNPLAPIRYALPILDRTGVEGAAAQAIQVIHRQVDHLTRLVDDLLDVSRITHGTIELRQQNVLLSTIVNSACEAASPVIAAARHEFRVTVNAQSITVRADAARLTQVVTNLLNNASRYTPRGGRIELSAQVENGEAVIRVRDNGIGIPADALEHIFDMFRQLDRHETSSLEGGLGIGLALSRRLVELHGGSIQALSAGSGQGTEFVVRLPVVAAVAQETPSQRMTAAAAGRPLKVLIVDDNHDLVDMLAMIVEDSGHEVRRALDGRSAIAAALAYGPDVVLLDLGLPLVSGIEVARELRRHPHLSSMRIVALTGWGQAEDRARTAEAGFDEHLTKPTDPERVAELIREYATRAAS